MSDPRLLTVPALLASDAHPPFPAGNQYVALPECGGRGPTITSVNVCSGAASALLEMRGDPLLCLEASVDGELFADDAWTMRRLNGWTPCLQASMHGVTVTVTLLAPLDTRGALLTTKVVGGRAAVVRLVWRGSWASGNRVIFSRTPLAGRRVAEWDAWTNCLLLHQRGTPEMALALAGDGLGERIELEEEDVGQASRIQRDDEGPISFRLTREMIASNIPERVTLYLAAHWERDGARTTSVALRREGAKAALARTDAWLSSRLVAFAAPWTPLRRRAVENLWFNLFYATARGIDDDELYLLTSRSPRYYVSAAFWARDSLLWSLPGLCLLDRPLAHEALRVAYRRHLRQAGQHAHYLSGVVLYPGFELDELASYALALDAYLRDASEEEQRLLWSDRTVVEGARSLLPRLLAQRDAETGLYRTELLASDDPAPLPFSTYGNALAARALALFAAWSEELGYDDHERAALQTESAELRERLWAFAGPLAGETDRPIASLVDGRGAAMDLDEPPGSLLLLPHYAFCSADDPRWLATRTWISGAANPFWSVGSVVSGAGCTHARDPWVLDLANRLLCGDQAAASAVVAAPLDGGLACESIDAETGLAATGAAMASAAGWLGYAITVFEAASGERTTRVARATPLGPGA